MNEQLTLYSADRRGLYYSGPLTLMQTAPQGQVFLDSAGKFTAGEAEQHALAMFPDGLSFHGWHYITLRTWEPIIGGQAIEISALVETVFEYVRKADFPTLPSRFQSYYAFDSLKAAQDFAPEKRIVQVIPANFVRLDQKWLTLSNHVAGMSLNAHKYWSGAATIEPDWEYLLVPPIQVIDLPMTREPCR